MLSQLTRPFFRFRVNCWAKFTSRGRFDWDEFAARLAAADYRAFGSWREAVQSLGWAGNPPDGRWLFGVAGYRIWVYGTQAMQHELFHAAQDQCYNLFSRKRTLLGSLRAEYAAHLWGGPLIGIPLVYGGTLLVVGMVMFLGLACFSLVRV